MLPRAIRAAMQDTISVRVKTGGDAYGDDTYSTAVEKRARVTYRKGVVKTAGGQEVNTQFRVYCEDISGLTLESEVTLPDATVWTVKRFTRPAWPNGTRHVEMDL